MEYPLSGKEEFELYIPLSDQIEDGILFEANTAEGRSILRLTRKEGRISASVRTDKSEFILHANEAIGSLLLVWQKSRIALYADDALSDEEWPLGELPHGEWTILAAAGIPFWEFSEIHHHAFNPQVIDQPLQFYRPEGGINIGDCMPFADGDTFHLFYLIDRHHHKSKMGLGAHRWGHITSTDLHEWTVQSTAIDIDEQWEGSICTGSLIRKGGKICAFYAVRMSDRSAARITWAESEDTLSFQKSNVYFSLSDPYEAVSARDPFVFEDETGLYHMLVTTSLKNGEGCLAHLTSCDLESWQQDNKPFLVPGFLAQPECPELFKMGPYYWLVFSIDGKAMYFRSESMFGPWQAPQDNDLCGEGISVAKTAPFGGSRIAAGFIREEGYAGRLVITTIDQDGDRLTAGVTESVLPDYGSDRIIPDVSLQARSGRSTYTIGSCTSPCRLRADVTCVSGKAVIRYGTAFEITVDQRGLVALSAGTRKLSLLTEGSVHIDCCMTDNAVLVTANGKCLTIAITAPSEFTLSFASLWGHSRITKCRLQA